VRPRQGSPATLQPTQLSVAVHCSGKSGDAVEFAGDYLDCACGIGCLAIVKIRSICLSARSPFMLEGPPALIDDTDSARLRGFFRSTDLVGVETASSKRLRLQTTVNLSTSLTFPALPALTMLTI